jgi:MoaA/NifB/PqqE/SkfB family radical SAM enzyme
MEKLKAREHDFSSKLRQESVIQRLREYVLWQRGLEKNAAAQTIPGMGPLSINLDLTLACNFACPHCVDSMILNKGKSIPLKEIKKTLDVLHSNGLRSVILVGGGEPTLHPDFEEVVRTIKEKELQLGIVTNGSKLDKVLAVADLLKEKDWVRISIDAAREETFKKMHRPRTRLTLKRILEKAKKLKEKNPTLSLGYSFVIVWEDMDVNGNTLTPNLDEMSEAVDLAKRYAFDYVSFKPCLVRLKESQRESLLDQVEKEKEAEIAEKIRTNLEQAKARAGDAVKVLDSVNLQSLLNEKTRELKRQPKHCHMQFFRTVVTPTGVFHCPAFRGIAKAKIAGDNGYTDFDESLENTARSILAFDAEEECKAVGCFYHHSNWWLEELIHSGKEVADIETVRDDNFFL